MADTTLPSRPGGMQTANRSAALRGMVISLLINGALPFLIYWFLTHYTTTSEFVALVASGVPSIIDNLVGIIRKRRIDFLAGVVLLGIAVSLVVIVLGGNPKVFLIRESFFTIAFGLTFLGSLLFPRPLMFYLSRHTAAGNNPENIVWFNSLWEQAGFRTSMRTMTVVWGIGLLFEATVRITLVIILSTAQFLIISPFVIYGIIGILVVWTFRYSKQGRKRSEAMRQQMLAEQTNAPSQSA
ncbi:MAG: VC0807 family protein [Ktedonobacteraceae bacterium]